MKLKTFGPLKKPTDGTSAKAIASRLESAGEINKVNISAYTYELVRDHFECEYRGKLAAKGKGEIDMYFVLREKAKLH